MDSDFIVCLIMQFIGVLNIHFAPFIFVYALFIHFHKLHPILCVFVPFFLMILAVLRCTNGVQMSDATIAMFCLSYMCMMPVT